MEKDIEKYLKTRVEAELGGICLKIAADYSRGIPDRLCILTGGRVVWVELKQESGRLSASQIVMHEKLKRLGFTVKVIWSKKDVDEFIAEMK